MAINDQIKDEKLQHDIDKKKQLKYRLNHQENIIKIKILLVILIL